jgi:hypothetical protein
MLKFETMMKLNCWIGPLLAVIFLITLRQMVYDEMQKEQQPAIPAAMEKKKQEIAPPMAGTRLNRDTALLIISAH